MKGKILLILAFALLASSTAFADCTPGWYCMDADHKAQKDCQCNWNNITLCTYGCTSGVCNTGPNTPPAIPEVNLSPDPANEGNDLLCHAYSTDSDNDSIEYEFKWYKDNEFYKSIKTTSQDSILEDSHTSDGDNWMCKVRAYDYKDWSNYAYDTVVIGQGTGCTEGWVCRDCDTRAYRNSDCSYSNEENCVNGCVNGACAGGCNNCNSPPTDPNVDITPSDPDDSDNLTCRAYSSDADGDSIEYHFTWKRDGSTFRTHSTTNTYDSIDDSDTEDGEEWRCMVRAWDGSDYSDYGADTVLIDDEFNSCDFDIDLDPDYTSINMERNDSRSVSVRIKNNGCERVCLDLTGRDSSSYIDADASTDRVCLNENESTYVSLNIETSDAREQTYTVRLDAEQGSRKETVSITVRVDDDCGSCTGGNCISITSTTKNICRDSTGTISVKIRNNSSEHKFVELDTSSTSYLASFEEDEIEVDAHSYRYVDLEVYVYNDSSLGSHYVNVYAETDNSREQKKVYFIVKNCEEEEDNSFSMTLTSSCQSVDKGQDRNVSFSIRNRTSEKIRVELQTVADIPTQVPAYIDIEANDSETVKIKVSARESDKPGKHYVKVYAWNGAFRIQKTLCVDIEKKRNTVVSVEDASMDIEQCRNEVFVLLIENRGDYNEDYRIEVNNSTEANITLSEDRVEADAGESKQVFVNVNIPLNMETGDYDFDLLVKNGETFTKKIRFTVIEAETPTLTIIELTTFPSRLVMEPGEVKEVSLTVTNLSAEDIEDVKLEWQLPSFMRVTDSTETVEAGKTLAITMDVLVAEDTEPGYYTGWISMNVDGIKQTEEINVVIVEPESGYSSEEEQENGENALEFLSAGFFSLGGSAGIGLIILLAIVIIMIGLKGIIESDTDYRKPVWYRR